MSWTQLWLSVAGVVALALIARWLRLGESRIADSDLACATAEQLLVGFTARAALPGTDGNAALVAGNGTLALLKRHGAKVAARRLVPPLRITQDVEGIRVASGERPFDAVLLFGVTDAQVRALEASVPHAMTIH